MDIMALVSQEDFLEYTSNYDYKTKFLLDSFFPSIKTEKFFIEMERIIENGDLPVVALAHAFDTEARIGDRTSIEKLKLEQILVKEKLDQSERIRRYLKHGANKDQLVDYIYDDAGNLISRVLARVELMRNQLISTGKVSIDENNFKLILDYGYKDSHSDNFTGWEDPTHDIIADLNSIKAKARNEGKTITKAITSSKVLGYITANKAINELFAKALQLPTEDNIFRWIYANFGIQFAVNDDKYKVKANDKILHRFFPENVITFIAGEGTFGNTVYGFTPEEDAIPNATNSGYVTVSQWNTPDPVATWTKATALVLPVMNDIDRLFICKVNGA